MNRFSLGIAVMMTSFAAGFAADVPFAEDFALTIHPHPTLGEAVMEAAKHALGEAIHIANPRKKAH